MVVAGWLQWAERSLPSGHEQWGDKWCETFGDGRGTKHGEVSEQVLRSMVLACNSKQTIPPPPFLTEMLCTACMHGAQACSVLLASAACSAG